MSHMKNKQYISSDMVHSSKNIFVAIATSSCCAFTKFMKKCKTITQKEVSSYMCVLWQTLYVRSTNFFSLKQLITNCWNIYLMQIMTNYILKLYTGFRIFNFCFITGNRQYLFKDCDLVWNYFILKRYY